MKNRRSLLYALCFAALVVLFCFSTAMQLRDWLTARREAEAFSVLAQQVAQAKSVRGPEGEDRPELPEGAREDKFAIYARLAEENPDLFGWVEIEGTGLNYPVMHTPRQPQYYLRRGFDRRYALSGTPFLDGSCTLDCGNYLLYGHNMKNGTMFAALLSYAEEAFWLEHPMIQFDTLQEEGTYRILAAFYTEIYPDSADGVFRYHEYTDLRDEAGFDSYLRGVTQAALYDTGVTARYGDQLLTLSTCSYHTENGRFVVVARREEAAPDTALP